MMKSLLPLIAVIGLVGCANSPLDRGRLQQIAEGFAKVNRCTYYGKMSSATSADAQNLLNAQLKYQTYDQQELIRIYNGYLPYFNDITTGECNLIAAEVERSKPRSNPSQGQIYQPTNTHTFCNRIGGQVLCNSFSM